jgi:hypothetical protein
VNMSMASSSTMVLMLDSDDSSRYTTSLLNVLL